MVDWKWFQKACFAFALYLSSAQSHTYRFCGECLDRRRGLSRDRKAIVENVITLLICSNDLSDVHGGRVYRSVNIPMIVLHTWGEQNWLGHRALQKVGSEAI
jgi:hypothetical protein